MVRRRFYIVDVFAEARYAGNQLAVVRDSDGLTDREMQHIAREFNFSETTFLISETSRDGGYDVRIFTPREEVPFAGHPTLGTAFVVQQEILGAPASAVTLNLKVGQLPVAFSYTDGRPDLLWMTQRQPEFGRLLPAGRVATLLGLRPDQLDSDFPVQEVSTGLPFAIVPLRDLAAVRQAGLHPNRSASDLPRALLCFSAETYNPENQLNARVFADHYGVPEDPATGSANGCLAAYLLQHAYFGPGVVAARVEQGYEIGRPSLLRISAEEQNGRMVVRVGGRVIPVAWGELTR
jgi:trans-2,3-dihydro-3-hydroxyanthranilate isomerase